MDRLLVLVFETYVSDRDRIRARKKQLLSELPGIFNWAIGGLRRLWQQDAFSVPVRMPDEILELRYSINPVLKFCDAMLVADDSESIPSRLVYAKYANWSERLPTLEEPRSFLADKSAAKRNRWFDRLLTSIDYASYCAN